MKWDSKRDWTTASTSWGDNVEVSARLDNDCGKKQQREVSKHILTDHTQYTIPYINTNPFFQEAINIGATNNTDGAGIMLHDVKNYAKSHPTSHCEVIKLDPGDNSSDDNSSVIFERPLKLAKSSTTAATTFIYPPQTTEPYPHN